jgi:uncharacterized iron-regulated membrane protein
MFRKTLFWLHLCAGVIGGLVILIMSVTGVLLMYEKQIVAYVDRRAAGANGMAASAAPESARLGVEALLAAVSSGSGTPPSNITLRADAREPVTMTLGRDSVLVDPTSGEVLAPQQAGIRAFFRSTTDWHRWLGATPEGRNSARAITGASNFAFLLLVTSGLVLWFPRKWRWQNVRAVLWFRGGLSGKARDFNWHNTAGFWCCVPLFFVVLSGVVMSYSWANNLVYTMNGVQPPAQGKGKDGKGKDGRGKGGPREEIRAASFTNLDALVAQVKIQQSDWRSIAFPIPSTDDAPVTFNVDSGNGGQPQERTSLTIDRVTAEVKRAEVFTDQDAGRQARQWMRFVHTGEYYGFIGQTVAGIASAGGALLVWTGIALAYRRFRAWISRDRSRARDESRAAAA